MRKIITIIIALISLVFIAAGCSRDIVVDDNYTTTVDGHDAVISFLEGNHSEGTIDVNNFTYKFAYSMDGSLSIVYPNGYTYSQRDVGGAIAVSADYDAKEVEELGYIDGFSLARAISSASDSGNASGKSGGVSVIASLFLLAIGIWYVADPRSAWWISRGWWFKNAEPSDSALMLYRMGGCILVFVGIISFFT